MKIKLALDRGDWESIMIAAEIGVNDEDELHQSVIYALLNELEHQMDEAEDKYVREQSSQGI